MPDPTAHTSAPGRWSPLARAPRLDPDERPTTDELDLARAGGENPRHRRTARDVRKPRA